MIPNIYRLKSRHYQSTLIIIDTLLAIQNATPWREHPNSMKFASCGRTAMECTNDNDFSARAHHGWQQLSLQTLTGEERCPLWERELCSRVIFRVGCGEKQDSFEFVSDFDRGKIVAYGECGLSFRGIGHLVGCCQSHSYEYGISRRSREREDRHTVHMALMGSSDISATI